MIKDWSSLHSDILFSISKFLDKETRVSLSKVNKRIYELFYINVVTNIFNPIQLHELLPTREMLQKFLQEKGSKISSLNLKRIKPEILGELVKSCPNLRTLTITASQIDHLGAKEIANLTDLTELNLQCNYLNDAGVAALASLINLNVLNLESNGIGAKGVETLSGLTKLTELNLASNKLGETGVRALSSLINLKVLNLRSNEIGARGESFSIP